VTIRIRRTIGLVFVSTILAMGVFVDQDNPGCVDYTSMTEVR
jgi:hypothetical protein